MKLELIAAACHAINAAYCASQGDTSQPTWAEAPDWQKQSAVAGVEMHLANPQATPEQSHESWLAVKLADGWKYGKTKDADKKVHPCCVPYAKLPAAQKAKDFLFKAVVEVLKDIPDADFDLEALRAQITADVTKKVGVALAARNKALPAAVTPGEFLPVKYIGKRLNHVDGAYGTRIQWPEAGVTRLVPGAIARKMLELNPDVYTAGEASADLAKPVIVKTQTDEDPTQATRDAIVNMDKTSIDAFTKAHFNVDLGADLDLGASRDKLIQLVDRFGVA
jgi:hypothetical protein